MDLIVTMDDATSEVYSMILVDEEGTASTFAALREAIGERGLFCALYTDRGSHYFHTPEAGGKVSSTALTQVGRALAHLGIEHIAAYSPQARGRSERMFATLQDRLPKELRLAGIATVEAANAWLKSHYVAEHNARFAVDPEQEGSAFVPDAHEMWREILCVVEERTVDRDNTVAWNGRRLQLPESRLRPHFVRTQVKVHEYPDGACAVFLGPHRLADYDAQGALLVPIARQSGAVLGAVKDKPSRARWRASLTAPARDASSAAQAGTRKRPPSRTRKHPHPNRRSAPHDQFEPGRPRLPSGSTFTQKTPHHALQKHDRLTRYGHASSAQASRTACSKLPRLTLCSFTPKLFSEWRMAFSRSRNLRFRLRRWVSSSFNRYAPSVLTCAWRNQPVRIRCASPKRIVSQGVV